MPRWTDNASFDSPPPQTSWTRILGAMTLLACIAVATGWYWTRNSSPANAPATQNSDDTRPNKAGENSKLFANWPQQQDPLLTFVFTGQTYGYLSPCGCSRPQKGGLERRANFMDSLRSKGWEVIGLDLGDAGPPKGVHKQNLLKYKTTMRALNEMGYAAIGLGEYDFSSQLFELLAEFTLNNPNKPPTVLGANLVGVQRDASGKIIKEFSREQFFPGGGDRSMVEGLEVIARPGKPAVGVIAVIGPDVAEKVVKLDPQFGFLANPQFLPAALKQLDEHPAKPTIRVLLYAGKLEQARAAASAFPQFQIILCQADDPEPPDFPTLANNGKTIIVQVGHKGQNVGVVGVYNGANGFELKYQRVPLGEEYLTPDDPKIEANHKVLQILQEYADEVKRQDYLKLHRANPLPHPAQIQNMGANLTFVGSDACTKCHAAEAQQYAQSKHSHAYDALVKYAKRPNQRQYDGECVICHTVGFEYVSGFDNEKDTPNLKNVGCENCHGPGSGHVANPNDKKLYAALSPWKTKADDKLPDLEFIKKMAATNPIERGSIRMPPGQVQLINAVSGMCMKCHDTENDPKFDFYEYMPKIWHSGLKTKGLPAEAK